MNALKVLDKEEKLWFLPRLASDISITNINKINSNMRKLLLFFAMLSVSIGMRAENFTWTSEDGQYEVTASDVQVGNSNTYQKLVVSGPGALAAFVEATKNGGDPVPGKPYADKPLYNLGNTAGPEGNRVNLIIEGEMNSDDFSALNSDDVSGWSKFTSLNLTNAESIDFTMMSDMKMGGLQYLQLPGNMTDQDKMKQLNSQNPNLGIVISVKKDTYTATVEENGQQVEKKYNSVYVHSFTANNIINASLVFQEGYNGFEALKNAKYVAMSGNYGNTDLANGTSLNFGNAAIWDFTGAYFEDCTMPGYTFTAASEDGDGNHYDVTDPFKEHPELIQANIPDGYETNAFYQFNLYANDVVEITLPDQITTLPPASLAYLGSKNKDNYKLVKGMSEEDFTALYGQEQFAPIEDLVIPDNYIYLDYECGVRAKITHLVIGGNVKEVRAGAFANSTSLSDLDFGAGLSNCKLGALAFGECKSMKHIALSEGIVSVGSNAFSNSIHLESIRLPETLLYIGNEAFKNCLALNSITIPENVEKIGQKAFALCPFTDIFLTTTDPEKIPMVWSAGTGFGETEPAFDGNCTFNHGHIDGWEGGLQDADKELVQTLTFDEAAAIYYMHWNGMPVLHYPEALADAVRAQISSTYAMKSSDEYGLPDRQDMIKRSNIEGADLGTKGVGKYTKDGWAQFMLMKEFSKGPGSEVYTKEYDDVWYTMCFPFDLSDEQLAGAFNETFNIVDFSGVEIKEANEEAGTPKKLVLHFNNVAITHYKDTEGNLYSRKTDANGDVIREQHGAFRYNVYLDGEGNEYHHVHANKMLEGNKTKTFAQGHNLSEAESNKNNAVIIDGILASAGHPYMIHPAIGFNDGGNNKKKCNFSGITWKPMTQWASIFDAEKRTVDLGEAKGNQSTGEPDEDNFFQAAYSDYAGQTYTFIGNATEYRADAQAAIGNEPQVPDEPKEPVAPSEPTEILTEPTERISAPTPLTAEEQELVSKLTDGKNENEHGPWYGITEQITATLNDGSDAANLYSQKVYIFVDMLSAHGYNIYGGDAEAAFNWCKETFNKNISYASDYAAYLANQAEWNAYNANQQAWYDYEHYDATAAQAAYTQAMTEYTNAVTAHNTWVENAKKWLTYIPKNAYFLGRKTGQLPKYYREVAENPAEGQASTRKGGVWSQFTAIVIPNDAAVSGIESELDGKTASSKGFDMAFDESFLGDFIEQEDVVTLIEKAQEEGAKVEYMDIVVSINGQVVRRGSTSLEGLPRGMYIINGKKYFVK